MTDRSSEERSRFENEREKDLRAWFENWCKGFSGVFPLDKDRFGDYHSVLTGNVWILCRRAITKGAALEDRQEAAAHLGGVCPKCHWFICQCQVPGVPSEATKKDFCPSCHSGDPKKRGYIVGHRANYENVCFDNFHERVPSDATPSKENAPLRQPSPAIQAIIEADRMATLAAQVYAEIAAPAPEVQETPKIDPNWPWTAEQVAAESPVGTPQKETPPMPTNRHGQPVSAACYAGKHEECAETFVTCNCTYRGKHNTVHAYATAEMAAPVPEGVQGKEPQTPGRCPQCNSDKRWVRNITAIPVDGAETNSECCHPWHDTGTSPKYEPLDGATCDVRARDFHARFSPISLQELQAFQSYERNDAFGSGEAAGRRSAITELNQAAQTVIAARTAWLESYGVPISQEFANFAEAIGNLTELVAKCSELQEKTKP